MIKSGLLYCLVCSSINIVFDTVTMNMKMPQKRIVWNLPPNWGRIINLHETFLTFKKRYEYKINTEITKTHV